MISHRRARLTLLATSLAMGCGLLAAPHASAAVFAVVRSEPDVVTVIDPRAVEAIGATAVRRAWNVSVQRNLVSGGPQQPGYVRTLNEYDCLEHRVRWKSFFVYSRFGALVMHKDNDDDAWNPAPDAGEAGMALRVVCEGGDGAAAIAAQSVSQLVISLMQAWDEATPLPPLQKVDPPPRKPTKKRSPKKHRR